MQNLTDVRDDSVLVRQLVNGNILAFNTLFRKYSSRLFRFAIGYLKSDDEAEELVQEVFTKVWEKRKDLKEELSFKFYLFTIAFNLIRKHFRKRASLSNYLNSGLISDLDIQTSQKITCDSLFQFISRLVNLLPQRRKEIFIKSRFEGLTIKEISEDLNISHKTVENQLTDALKFIRTNIRSEYIPFILFIIIFST
jgi:RNA polymerase sigma-70 factor (ECF subfamily)